MVNAHLNAQKTIVDLQAIVAQLRDPNGGCPWDLKQDFHSFLKCTIEETYEVVDAITREDWENTVEELGDLLLQVLFYAQLGHEAGHFQWNDIISTLYHKLIRRHPHVFGDQTAQDASQALGHWEAIKKEEKKRRQLSDPTHGTEHSESILDDIPNAFPALLRANKLQKRCAQHGFDWDTFPPVLAKVAEELQEVNEAHDAYQQEKERAESHQQVHLQHCRAHLKEEVGDLLFAVVNLARHLDCDPEEALRNANHKFERRFRQVETLVAQEEKQLTDFDLEQLDQFWDQVKQMEV